MKEEMAVNKYDAEKSRKEMEDLVAKGVSDRGFFKQLWLATIAAIIFVVIYLVACLGLFVASIVSVQAAQSACLNSGLCRS